MSTARLVASTYAVSNTSYASVSNISNAYTDTDSTTYATITNTRSNSTSSVYLYIRGFNFSSLPSDAIVTAFTVKVKGYTSGISTSTSYAPRLVNGTSAISNTTASSNFGTSTKTITIPTGALSWDSIVNTYGSNFGIRIDIRRSSSGTEGYLYLYGAEIEVTYTVPVYHDVSVTNSTTATVSPTGTQTVLEGSSFTVTTDSLSGITVTDNSTDVTSSFVQQTSGTSTLVPTDYEATSFTMSNASNMYNDATNTTYATAQVAGSATGTLYLDLGGVSIPSGATIQSVSCQATLQFNANNSSSGFTSSMQMYAGTTAKGSATQWVSSGSNVSKTTYTLSIGSWTASEIANARFYLTATNSARSTARQIYVYGVSFAVTYELQGTLYAYTFTVNADHAIVFSTAASDALYVKLNGTWTEVQRAYVKSNGSWVQTAVNNVFQSGTNYVKG